MTVAAWIRGLPVGVVAAIKGAFDPNSSTALTATGSTLGTALALPRDFNVFTTVAASTGAALPAGDDIVVSAYTDANGTTRNLYGVIEIGDTITVINRGANAITIYPYSSTGTVQGGGAGVGYSQAVNTIADYRYVGSGNWNVNKSA